MSPSLQADSLPSELPENLLKVSFNPSTAAKTIFFFLIQLSKFKDQIGFIQ